MIKETFRVLRRFKLIALAATLLLAVISAPVSAQTDAAPKEGDKEKQEAKKEAKKEAKFDPDNPTAEQITESVIFIYGSRPVMDQIRRNGVERGKVTRALPDGRAEEITYEQRFVRGADAAKDKIRLDQKSPSVEYALVSNEGNVWGIINGTPFTPRPETLADFRANSMHGLDALLRYKENGSTLKYIGKDKQKNIDMWILEVADKNQNLTRYYISSGKGRVLWLEYERATQPGGTPVKYKRTFHDYRYAQNTLVPYRSVLYADDKQLEESRVLTVTYGIKMDDTFFQNPQAADSTQP